MIEDIIMRKRQGIDCTADESAEIKDMLDQIMYFFPCELSEWYDELERGVRPAQPFVGN